MSLLDLVRRPLINWAVSQMEVEVSRRRGHQNCVLDPTATLSIEAQIDNFSGNNAQISVEANSYVRGRLLVYRHAGRVTIGKWSYVGIRSEIWAMSSITIGDRVMIAHDVNIHDASAHSRDSHERHQHFRHLLQHSHPSSWAELPGVEAAPVIIEDDAWVGFGATILKGVRIGKGSIVAARSIVLHDVPPGMLYTCTPTPVLTRLDAPRTSRPSKS